MICSLIKIEVNLVKISYSDEYLNFISLCLKVVFVYIHFLIDFNQMLIFFECYLQQLYHLINSNIFVIWDFFININPICLLISLANLSYSCNCNFDKYFHQFAFNLQYLKAFVYILCLFFLKEELYHTFIYIISFQYHFFIQEYYLVYYWHHSAFFLTK